MSGSAFEQVRDKTAFAFDDLGERTLKNIDLPVRLYVRRNNPATSLLTPSAVKGRRYRSHGEKRDYCARGPVAPTKSSSTGLMKKAIGTLDRCLSELDIKRRRFTVLSWMPPGGKTHDMRPVFVGTLDF